MRRIRSLFFVSMAVMMLAGCGSEQETVETNSSVEALMELLGDGNVTVTLSLPDQQ